MPYELTKVVDRLLCKKPEGRFESAKEVHGTLQKLLSDFQSGKLRPRRLPTLKVLNAVQSPPRLAAAAVVLALAAAIAVFGWPSWRGHSGNRDGDYLAANPAATPGVGIREEARYEAEWRSAPSLPGMGAPSSVATDGAPRDLIATSGLVVQHDGFALAFRKKAGIGLRRLRANVHGNQHGRRPLYGGCAAGRGQLWHVDA